MFGMYCAQSNREQTRSFPEQKIAEQATVGIEELRCTGRRWRNHNPRRKTTGGSGARGPTD
jgi:hypothetical protein